MRELKLTELSPMMVTVATSLDVPIKLLFPKPGVGMKSSLAMLGLGDIILPGMMIGLALRYDLYLHYLKKRNMPHIVADVTSEPEPKRLKESNSEDKPKYHQVTGHWGDRFWSKATKLDVAIRHHPEFDEDLGLFRKRYFTAGIVGYIVGMIITLFAMHLSNHPQPALLYLVPSVLISLWGRAFIGGETKGMWSFSEEELEDNDEPDKVPKPTETVKVGQESEKSSAIKHLKAQAPKDNPARRKQTWELFSFTLTAPRLSDETLVLATDSRI
jgi:minor histocompatibility antigen H13